MLLLTAPADLPPELRPAAARPESDVT